MKGLYRVAVVLLAVACLCIVSANVTAFAAEKTYVRVNDEPTDWSGTYILTGGEDQSLVYTGAVDTPQLVSVTNNDGVIAAQNGFCELQITSDGASGYYIKLLGGAKAGKYLGTTTGTTGIEYLDEPISNGISFNEDGELEISCNGCLLKKRGGNLQIRYYQSGENLESVMLYKLQQSAEPSVAEGAISVTQSVSIGEGSFADGNTVYLQKDGCVSVTYAITQNDGVNSLLFSLDYNKSLFEVASVNVVQLFGADSVIVTGSEAQATDIKLLAEGDGADWNATATGVLATVQYKFLGADEAQFSSDSVTFGVKDVCVLKNGVSGAADVTFDFVSDGERFTYELRRQPQISVSTTTLTYSGGTFTAGSDDSSITVDTDSDGKLACAWFADEACSIGTSAKDAGTYYLRVSVDATAACFAAERTFAVTVEPFNLFDEALPITLFANLVQYTGQPLSLRAEDVVVSGGRLQAALAMDSAADIFALSVAEHSFVDVGEHVVNASLAFGKNYCYNNGSGNARVLSLTVSFNIVLYANAWRQGGEPKAVKKDFDGAAVILSYIAAEHGQVSFTVNGEEVVAANLDGKIVNAGEYVVEVTAVATGYSPLTAIFTVSIARLMLAWDEADVSYSGSSVSWQAPNAFDSAGEKVSFPDGFAPTFSYYIADTFVKGNTYKALSAGKGTLRAIPSDTVNYADATFELKEAFALRFFEGEHALTEGNVVEGKAAYATMYIFDGQVATAPVAPSVDGYNFAGWQVNGSAYKWGAVTESANLTAAWQVKSFTVTWDWANGTPSTVKTTVVTYKTKLVYDSSLGTPQKVVDGSRYEYNFSHWTVNGALLENYFVTANVTVTAQYTQRQVIFTLNYNVENTGESGALDVREGTLLSSLSQLPSDEYRWFAFDGWYGVGTSKVTVMPQADLSVTARYNYCVVNGDVDGNGSVDTGDVVLFRRYLVGGYKMTILADDAQAWQAAFDGAADDVYFHMLAANVDGDAQQTVGLRDVATLRMALVGGYGYDVDEGGVTTVTVPAPQCKTAPQTAVLASVEVVGVSADKDDEQDE